MKRMNVFVFGRFGVWLAGMDPYQFSNLPGCWCRHSCDSAWPVCVTASKEQLGRSGACNGNFPIPAILVAQCTMFVTKHDDHVTVTCTKKLLPCRACETRIGSTMLLTADEPRCNSSARKCSSHSGTQHIPAASKFAGLAGPRCASKSNPQHAKCFVSCFSRAHGGFLQVCDIHL